MRSLIILFVLIFMACALYAGDIHEAARDGDMVRVKAMLAEKPERIHETTASGATPLHAALTGRHREIASFLISKGADVNALTESHLTPLHYASAYNMTEIVTLLLEKGAEISQADREGKAAIHNAAIYGAHDALKYLISRGADIEQKKVYGRTPLILTARERGNIESATILLDAGADINAVDRWGDNALSLASWRGFKAFVDLLLDRGTKLPESEAKLGELLFHSINRKLVRLLDSLIAAGVDLSKVKDVRPSLINNAAKSGSSVIVQKLLEAGFDLTFTDEDGWTPLHCAAEYGRDDLILYLIKAGADINARTLLGQSPYNIAVEENSGDAVTLLKKAGCDTGPPRFPRITGEFLGRKLPGEQPEIFAPGIVEAHFQLHSSVAFAPDGKTAFWSVSIPPRETGYSTGRMLGSTVVDGKWTYPAVPSFKGGDVPFFSHDGRKLYFISRDPVSGQNGRKENLWYTERTATGWSDAKPMDPMLNSANMHWQFGVDEQGTFYIGDGQERILVSRQINGQYEKPVDFRERTGITSVYGGSPYISPGGDYLIFNRDDDLHITFLQKDGSWTKAMNMGSPVNSDHMENCPLITPCGKYLIYRTSRSGRHAVYWMAIEKVLKRLKNAALNQ